MVAKPGVRPGLPPASRPGGPRPQHPTSRGRIEPGLAPPPVEQRADVRASARVRQQRERVEEEKVLRPQRRQVRSPDRRPSTAKSPSPKASRSKSFREKLDVKANLVIKKLMDRGIFATINQTLDSKLATEMAREFGASTATVSYEDRSHAGGRGSRRRRKIRYAALPWSPSWATSITVRLRCSTPSAWPT